jgi:hypothetical protein
VEKVGIEPTTATIARRARFLSCHPQGRRPGPPGQDGWLRAATRDPERQRPIPGAPEAPEQQCGSALPHETLFR